MVSLDGIWRLVAATAVDEQGQALPPPYGLLPMGQITFAHGRMLAVLCKGEAQVPPGDNRSFTCYGGPYTFDGATLDTAVDVALDSARIGGHQIRHVEMRGTQMILRPPTRLYGSSMEQRELVWERIWPAPQSS